jgi:hypothetical protein
MATPISTPAPTPVQEQSVRAMARAAGVSQSTMRRRLDPEYSDYCRRRHNAWSKTLRGRIVCCLAGSRIRAKHRGYAPCNATKDELLAAWTGFCSICGDIGGKKHLCIDHCHKTGRFRGWLCSNCNLVIGSMKDDPALLRGAADYLERPAALQHTEDKHSELPDGRIKLTEEQVREIRRRYRRYSHKDGAGALAREFGVSLVQVWRIVKGHRRADVDGQTVQEGDSADGTRLA